MPIVAYSNISAGNMSFAWSNNRGDTVVNRQIFLNKYNVQLERCVLMDCSEHADNLKIVDRHNAGDGALIGEAAPVVDALITMDKDTGLLLLTADCYPVTIYDKAERIIALVHQGWRSAELELVPKVIARMYELSGLEASDLLVKIGPGIAPSSYVRDDIKSFTNPGWQPFLKSVGSDKFQIDVQGFVVKQCQSAGIKIDNIRKFVGDTATDLDQFSHYRMSRNDEVEGRFLTVAKLTS